MKTLTRPVTLRGFGDDSGIDVSSLPTTSTGAIDWSQLNMPAAPSYAPAPADSFNVGDLLKQTVTGVTDFYKDQTAITNAQTAAALAKAQGQAAINITKAGGAAAAAKAAGQGGLPSPSVLLIAGLGLAAIFLLKR